MQVPRVSFNKERERRYSYAVISEHVVHTPKIVRFVYQQAQLPKVTSVQPSGFPNICVPAMSVQGHVWCYKQQKMRSKPSGIENGVSQKGISQSGSNKFSLLTRKINATVAKRQNQGGEDSQRENRLRSCSEYTPNKDDRRQTMNSTQQSYRNHITFQAPTCDLFACDPQNIKTYSPQPRFTHKRQKIFNHTTTLLQLTPSNQLTNQTRTQNKLKQQQECKLDQFQEQRQYVAVKQREETVDQQEVPTDILQSWDALQHQPNEHRWLQ